MAYYTPRDLARDLGQSENTALRVFGELFPEHERGTWWRFEMSERERILRAIARNSRRRFGARRRRQGQKEVQISLF